MVINLDFASEKRLDPVDILHDFLVEDPYESILSVLERGLTLAQMNELFGMVVKMIETAPEDLITVSIHFRQGLYPEVKRPKADLKRIDEAIGYAIDNDISRSRLFEYVPSGEKEENVLKILAVVQTRILVLKNLKDRNIVTLEEV
jgi:chromosome segregation and condensation protein ScpB